MGSEECLSKNDNCKYISNVGKITDELINEQGNQNKTIIKIQIEIERE